MLQQPGRSGLGEEQVLASVLEVGLEEEGELEEGQEGLARNLDMALERLLHQVNEAEGGESGAEVAAGAGEWGGGEILCELKCITACVTWFPHNPRPEETSRAVDRRADGLTKVYGDKARAVDILYCGTPKPQKARRGQPQPVCQIGPVETRLLEFGRINGWVFGPWGEANLEIHILVQGLARHLYSISSHLLRVS